MSGDEGPDKAESHTEDGSPGPTCLQGGGDGGLDGQMGGGGPGEKSRRVDLTCTWSGSSWALTPPEGEIFSVGGGGNNYLVSTSVLCAVKGEEKESQLDHPGSHRFSAAPAPHFHENSPSIKRDISINLWSPGTGGGGETSAHTANHTHL